MASRKISAPLLLTVVLLLCSVIGWSRSADPVRPGFANEQPAAPSSDTGELSGDLSAQQPRAADALPAVRRIDSAAAFEVRLDAQPAAMSRAFLVYELAGVPHWTAAVRSINGLPALGGFGAVASSGTELQVEEINARWLHAGLNQITFFPAPADQTAPSRFVTNLIAEAVAQNAARNTVPYTVRNLRVVYVDGTPERTPNLRLSHPLHGESDAAGTVLRGYVDPPQVALRPAELFVDASYVPHGIDQADGSFAVFVPRASAAGEPWETEIEVVYADGSRLRRTVKLTGTDASDADDAADVELDAGPGSAESFGDGEARLEVTPGALAARVKLKMRGLRRDQLPAMDAGMTNVTPNAGGFRFGPHGLRFRKPVQLSLPYDAALIPHGMTADDVRTFFFDEEAGRWMPLARVDAKTGGGGNGEGNGEGRTKPQASVIVSATDHFTDFVNATLVLPEESSGANASPNSLQELAQADPASQIVQIEPPEGGASGDATLDFPLVVPPGRNGLGPELAVRYDSAGDDGWLGVGWDLKISSIEVSTLFGVPRYDGTERYVIDGDQLAATPAPGVFVRRVEGSFDRIVRSGNGPGDYWWEVTDKNGTRSIYGRQACLREPANPQSGKIFRWYLEQEIDIHGNTVTYSYSVDSGSNGEPWTEVYPAGIDYTGGPGVAAFYHVTFILDGGNRPDRISSGRAGFKTYLRRRLARVDVRAGSETVRQYIFEYGEGDFHKSLLTSIIATGEGGAEFYRHTFDYVPMAVSGDGYDAFSATETWSGIDSSKDLTDSIRGGGGAHGFVGLGPPGCQPHVGGQLGGSGTDTTQRVSFLDVNGDGLPDRLDESGRVDLNGFDVTADGAGAGRFSSVRFANADTLGHTSEWSLDVGVGAHAEAGFPAHVDLSWVWSHANEDHLVTDINGDLRPDLVSTNNGFAVRVNNGHGFEERPNWSGFTASRLSLSSSGEESEVMSRFTRSDALRQLALPYAGHVTVSGVIQKKEAAGDGVDAAIYRNAALLWSRRFAANDTAPCAPGPGNSCAGGLALDVNAGDSLYFVAGSVRETSADALLWAPVVSYDGRDPQAREPYGARTFVFDAADDFALAGYRGPSWAATAGGNIRVSGPLVKQETSDDVTLVVSVNHHGAVVPLFTRTFAAGELATFDAVPPIHVDANDLLFLRLTSRTPIDPKRIQWAPMVTYVGATDPASLPDDVRTSPAQVGIAVPQGFGGTPTQSWTATSTGAQKFHVACVTTTPATLYVQGVNRLLSVSAVSAGTPSFDVTVNASAGDPLFVSLISDSGTNTCTVNSGAVPLNVRSPRGESSNVLSGGHHNWFYGEWNGDVAFNPARLVAPRDENDRPDFVSGAPHWEVTKATVRPAWTAAGFDLYLSAEGVKPSRRGANAAGVLDQASGVTAGGDLSVLRKTAGRTEAIAAGAGGGGLSLSRGTSDTQLDLLDMNGDRYPDQVSPDGVRFSNGSSGFGDLQRIDGLGGAVRSSEDGNVSATIGIGINFTKKNANGKPTAVVSTLPSVGSTISVSQTKYDLIDVNGDNLPDRVTMNPGDGAMTVQLNLGYRFGAAESWNLPAPSASGHCNDTFDYVTSAIGSLSSLDTLNGMSFTRSSAAQAGVAVGPFGGTVSTTLARTLVELADINGDGLVDRVIKDQQQPGSGYFRVQLNLGDHWDVEHRWYIPDWPRSVSLGDGYNPGGLFQCLDAVTFSGHVEVQGSVGVPICIPLIPPTPVVGLQIEVSAQAFASTSSGLQLFLEDLDGDGLSDHVLKKAGDGNVYVKRNQAGKVNLLKAVHRPLGSTIEISYERRGNHPDMPFSQWVLAQVSVSEKPGTTPYVTRYHYDNDAVYDRTERANYGYGHLKVTLPDGSTVDRNFDNHDFYNRHAKTKEVLADAQGNLFRVETARYEDKEVTGSGSSRFPALMARTTSFYEGTTSVEASAPKTTAATFEYDRLGNVIRTTDSADAGVDDDVNATIAYQFSPNGPLTRPASIEVRDGTGRLLRQRQGTYNDNGDLIRLEQILAGGRDPENGSTYSGSKNAVWTLAYDALGNVVSSADPSGFTTTFTYDAATRTHPIEVRDSFGYVTGYNYDLKYGQLAQTTDQNGNTIARAFDGFGRIVRVVGPYDSEASPALAFEYGADAATHWAVVHHKDSTRFDTIDSATFIDSLERVVETKEETEVDQGSGTSARAGMRVSGRIGFDAKGRIVTEGQPVFDDGPANRFVEVAAKNPTTFTYDTVDRVRTVRFPTGAVTRVDYGFGAFGQTPRFLTVRTDPAGRVTRFYRDVSNNVVGVEQTNTIRGARKTLLTAYAYDALDQLTAVTDAKGNVTRLEYDTLGRNVTLDNPDLGRTEFRYDPAGTLGAKITANLAARNQQIRYFSTFGRLDRIDYPQSPDVVYTYGAPGASLNRANRIVTVTDASGVEESSYGKLGEVVQLVKTTAALNGSTPKGPYTTRFQFDDFDRLLSVVYPDGETLTYGYDAGGQVKSASGVLKGVRFDYLRYLGYDEFGERTRMILGNGVETRSTYDPVSRFLTQLRTTGAGRDLQNLRYQYDLTGTALALQNDVPVPAPSLYGGPTSQTFQYDDIAQLVGAQGTYRTGPNTTSTYTLGLNYDELGNTIAKNQLHQTGNNGKLNPEKKTSYNWAYTYAALQPHAATHVGDRTFRYDADGNQLGWDSDANGTRRTLTWDEENRLASVADNGQTTRFLYDADGTRTNKAGQNGETTYVNRWFTIRNGAIASKHIFADDVRLATKVSPDANPRSEKAYFFQADNLGSTQFVTDELGAVYQHLEYFPSGEVWVDERSETQRTPYLFSGKELDEETGLSYFGHRYYDARQGQWISTDPILDEMLNKLESADASADPFHLPGNMSGYVANDPVNQTDPDGLSRGKRLGYVGGTPGKYSTTGRTVIDRMKADKFVKGTGNKQMVFVSLGKGNKTVWKTVDKDIHMGHLVDAVRLWNGVGRFFGKKHPIVRDMMKDPDNYVLEYGPANMSKGAKLGATTQYDEPHSKLWDNLKSKDMKSWLAAFRKARKDFLTPVEWKQLRKHVPKEAQ